MYVYFITIKVKTLIDLDLNTKEMFLNSETVGTISIECKVNPGLS